MPRSFGVSTKGKFGVKIVFRLILERRRRYCPTVTSSTAKIPKLTQFLTLVTAIRSDRNAAWSEARIVHKKIRLAMSTNSWPWPKLCFQFVDFKPSFASQLLSVVVKLGRLAGAGLRGLRSAIAIYWNSSQGRLVPEKLDFFVAFIPLGHKRAGRYFESADVVIAEKIRLAEVWFAVTAKARHSLLGQHRDPVVNWLKAGFVGAFHEAGQTKREAADGALVGFRILFFHRPRSGCRGWEPATACKACAGRLSCCLEGGI